MKKWRNSPQKIEVEEMTARGLINTGISKMSELEFRTTIIGKLAVVEKSIESLSAEKKRSKI